MRISLSILIALALFLAATCAFGVQQAGAAQAPHLLDRIKLLEGTWVAVDEEGKPTEQVVSVFHQTAGGSAVIETLFPGTDHEMITVYHARGKELVLEHYCVLGNQPRMELRPDEGAPNQMVFRCTGLGDGSEEAEAQQHMHQGTFTILGKDRYQSEWQAFQDGKVVHTAAMDVVRVRS